MMNPYTTAKAAWRAAHPMARRERTTAITHNGGSRTIYTCICGDFHTTSTEWHGRNAKHVIDWRDAHDDCFMTWHDAQQPRD